LSPSSSGREFHANRHNNRKVVYSGSGERAEVSI
jgi:hypothetical protein